MAKFIVKGAVKYKGAYYTSGQVVEVDKADVEEFKNHGWKIVKPNEPQKPNPDGEGEGKGDEGKEEKQVALNMYSKKDLIIAELEKRGITFNREANKAELLALLA